MAEIIRTPLLSKVAAKSGRVPAYDANLRGTVSGRTEFGAFFYVDDFWNRQLKQEWATRVTTGAVGGAPTSTDLNGVLEMLTGAVATNEESLDWNDIFVIQNTLRPTFEIRLNLAQVDNDTNVAFGFVDTSVANGIAEISENVGGGEDLILIMMSDTIYSDTNWHLHCQAAGVSTSDAGAAAAASTWVVIRFEFITDTSVEWFINNVSQGIISTNVPTDPMQPMLFILTDAGAAKSVDIDYVKIWQDRV